MLWKHLTFLESRIIMSAMDPHDVKGRVTWQSQGYKSSQKQGWIIIAWRTAVQALAAEASGVGGWRTPATQATRATQIVRIKPTTLPIFSGCKREYHRWKKGGRACKGRESHLGHLKSRRLTLWVVWMTGFQRISGSQPTALQRTIQSHGKQVWKPINHCHRNPWRVWEDTTSEGKPAKEIHQPCIVHGEGLNRSHSAWKLGQH